MILIIGAGLSGLLIAHRLQQLSIPFKILETRNRVGGRIFTQTAKAGTPVEMGATWFGYQHTYLHALIKELGLSYFEQQTGDFYLFHDPSSHHQEKYQFPRQEPSFRLVRGTSQLINKLIDQIDLDLLLFGQEVQKVIIKEESVDVLTSEGKVFKGKKVILTHPPRLWSSKIEFTPSLSPSLLQIARNTQTWMEDSTKAAVEYTSPFWRTKHSISAIFSNHGPFIECYDHTDQDGTKFALCGFLNPAFNRLGLEQRKEKVIAQLFNVFGEDALHYSSYNEYLWDKDPFTKLPLGQSLLAHQNNGHPIFRESYFNDKVMFSGSETSEHYAGYMEGAVRSAAYTVEKLKKDLTTFSSSTSKDRL